jgi:GxxExxY protein
LSQFCVSWLIHAGIRLASLLAMDAITGNKNGFVDGSSDVIGACIDVHRHLGPGLLESTYERCLAHELTLRRLAFQRQLLLPVSYKGEHLDCGYRIDFIVADTILVEIKAVERLQPIHTAQVLTYLKLTGLETGLLVNFNVPVLKHGLRRLTRKQTLPVLPSSCEHELQSQPYRTTVK